MVNAKHDQNLTGATLIMLKYFLKKPTETVAALNKVSTPGATMFYLGNAFAQIFTVFHSKSAEATTTPYYVDQEYKTNITQYNQAFVNSPRGQEKIYKERVLLYVGGFSYVVMKASEDSVVLNWAMDHADPEFMIEVTLSIAPGTGEVIDMYMVLTGKDIFSGTQYGTGMRSIAFLGLVSGVGSGRAAVKGAEEIARKAATKYNIPVEQVLKYADEIAGPVVKEVFNGTTKAKDALKRFQELLDAKLLKYVDEAAGVVTSATVKLGDLVLSSADDVLKWMKKAEKSGTGHSLSKHAGKSSKDLKDRILTDPNIKKATSFPNETTASKVVYEAMTDKDNAKIIKDWIEEGAKDTLNINYNSTESIGYGFKKVGEELVEVKDIYDVRVGLREVGGEIVPVTAFPGPLK